MIINNMPIKISDTFNGVTWTQEYYDSVYNSYERPSEWLELPELIEGEQKFIGLHLVYPHNSNFVALNVQGNYTVDWGDGIVENYNSGIDAYHNFQYESFSGQVECSYGYKQSIVTITPQNGSNLTVINLDVKHNQSGLQNYNKQWIEIGIVGSQITSIDLGGSGKFTQYNLEIFNFVGTNLITNFNSMFYYCTNLKRIKSLYINNATSVYDMFSNCKLLKTIPLMDTSNITNFNNMFHNSNIETIPLLDTSSGTNFSNMFDYCSLLKTIPLFDTSSGTNFSNMFSNCYILKTIPLFDTSSGTNFSSMFSNCYGLYEIPLLNTSSGTTFMSMFSNCNVLKTIPLLNTINGIDFGQMFYSCYSLESLPQLNFNKSLSFDNIFSSCYSLGVSLVINTKINISYSFCKLSSTELNTIYNNLGTVTNKTITVSGNWGVTSDNTSIATTKGWSVSG